MHQHLILVTLMLVLLGGCKKTESIHTDITEVQPKATLESEQPPVPPSID